MQTEVTVTLGEILDFLQAAQKYLNRENLKPSYLTQAISKMVKSLKKHVDEFDDEVVDIRIDLAHKDKSDGTIELHDNGAYKMKADSAKKMQASVRRLREKKVSITPYYAKVVPKNLALPWYEYFVPFVIADYPEPVMEEETLEKE